MIATGNSGGQEAFKGWPGEALLRFKGIRRPFQERQPAHVRPPLPPGRALSCLKLPSAPKATAEVTAHFQAMARYRRVNSLAFELAHLAKDLDWNGF